MSLPALASIPPANVRLSLESPEWEACLDAWIMLAELHLRAATKQIATAVSSGDLSSFLRSYYHELATLKPSDGSLRSQKAQTLHKLSFALVRRSYLEVDTLDGLLDLDFLSDFCRIHIKSTKLPNLLSNLWKRKAAELQKILQKTKDALIVSLDSPAPETAEWTLSQLAPILRASPDIAILFTTGTDLLDSLVSGYTKSSSEQTRKAIVMTIYLGLIGCVSGEASNTTMISDHLYSLKSQMDGRSPSQSLLADLVTNTALLAKLRRSVGGKSPERLLKLFDNLETFRSPSIARAQRRPRRKVDKGKSRQTGQDGDLHVHRMSFVTQIQDLFPDLGAGFVLRLLDEYNDDVEQVTAHLLDDSLPPHLRLLDRSEQAPIFDVDRQQAIDHLAPNSTPPPTEPYVLERRNKYDNDELDRLEFDTSRLHIGKQERNVSEPSNKAAILSALAAFDSDDDERDDTYDAEDVGGTIDAAHPDGEPGLSAKVTQDDNDMALFTAYKSSPELFGRTFDVRRGQARASLKSETGMTDEAIEGWAIMLQRDPRRLKRLETQSGAFDGRQAGLAKTAYRESPVGTETEDSDAAGERGGFRGRGRGRGGRGGGRGRGGNVAGASGDPATANAQRRKESSKGSRANHNRRDQRAKKMARGGFPG